MKFFLAFWAFSTALISTAQADLIFRVVDETSATILGVVVSSGNQALLTSASNRNESDRLTGLKFGPNQLHLSYIGYADMDTTINVVENDNTVHIFKMRQDVRTMRAAEISALRAGETAPFAKTLLTKAEIARVNTGVDLPYLLELTPSVVTTSDAGTGIGYTGMRIRGTDATRTNITLNGVPFNDAESQGAFLVNLPDLASSVEDIEIQRGVGTSTNGPAAFGATVNISTTTIKYEPWGKVGVSGGSFNTQRYSVSGGTGLINDRFSLDMRLSSITSDGYIDRATSDLKSYFIQGAWVGKKRSLRLITFRGKEKTYQAWAGVPREVIDTNRTYNPYSYKNEVDNYDQTHYQVIFEEKLSATSTFSLTGFRVDGNGYYENLKTEVDNADYFPSPIVVLSDTVLTNDIVIRRWLNNTLVGVNSSLTKKINDHTFILGGSYSNYGGSHYGEVIWAKNAGSFGNEHRYYDNNATKTDGNVYAKLDYSVCKKVKLFGDVQIRNVTYDFLGYDDERNNVTQRNSYTFFNPKLGANWALHKDGRLYGSVAIANREPNRDDLTETTPRSRPESERLTDFEIGYERRAKRTALGLNGYFMDYTDQLVLTGELNDVGAALRTNVAQSYRAGMELTWEVRFTDRFRWKANATYGKSRITNFSEYIDDWDTGEQKLIDRSATPIAFSPEFIGASELTYRFWNTMDKGNAELTFVTKYVGPQYLDNSGSSDRSLNGYWVNDVRVNTTIAERKGRPQIDINLTARNILSERYASNGWSYSYMIYGDREALVGLYPQALLNVLGGVTVSF